MAFATTTLSSAVGTSDISIVVASATSFAAGRLLIVDQELMQVTQAYSSGTTIPVLRGRDGRRPKAIACPQEPDPTLSPDTTRIKGRQ